MNEFPSFLSLTMGATTMPLYMSEVTPRYMIFLESWQSLSQSWDLMPLMNPKVQCHVHKSLIMYHILCPLNSAQTFKPYTSNFHFNIIQPKFPGDKFIRIFSTYAICPANFIHLHQIKRTAFGED
jgi:hypothetical protein